MARKIGEFVHSEKDILSRARNYTNRATWRKENWADYHTAHRRGFLNKLYAFLPKPKRRWHGVPKKCGWWTKEAVMYEAAKHKTRTDWFRCSQASYRAAKRRGWYDEATAHMPVWVHGTAHARGTPESIRDARKSAKIKFYTRGRPTVEKRKQLKFNRDTSFVGLDISDAYRLLVERRVRLRYG